METHTRIMLAIVFFTLSVLAYNQTLKDEGITFVEEIKEFGAFILPAFKFLFLASSLLVTGMFFVAFLMVLISGEGMELEFFTSALFFSGLMSYGAACLWCKRLIGIHDSPCEKHRKAIAAVDNKTPEQIRSELKKMGYRIDILEERIP